MHQRRQGEKAQLQAKKEAFLRTKKRHLLDFGPNLLQLQTIGLFSRRLCFCFNVQFRLKLFMSHCLEGLKNKISA
jgi:hypothetical protein